MFAKQTYNEITVVYFVNLGNKLRACNGCGAWI